MPLDPPPITRAIRPEGGYTSRDLWQASKDALGSTFIYWGVCLISPRLLRDIIGDLKSAEREADRRRT